MASYRIARRDGKISSVTRQDENGSETSFGEGHRFWPEFLDRNAKQPVPLDLSDKEPEQPEPDPVKDAIMALLDKDQNGVLSPAEKLDFCFKVCKRLVRGI